MSKTMRQAILVGVLCLASGFVGFCYWWFVSPTTLYECHDDGVDVYVTQAMVDFIFEYQIGISFGIAPNSSDNPLVGPNASNYRQIDNDGSSLTGKLNFIKQGTILNAYDKKSGRLYFSCDIKNKEVSINHNCPLFHYPN
jgi:hypothetical protein